MDLGAAAVGVPQVGQLVGREAELASRSGVSRDWVNSFERGKRTVDISLVFRLFDALGIEMEATDASAIGDALDGPPNLDALLDQYYER